MTDSVRPEAPGDAPKKPVQLHSMAAYEEFVASNDLVLLELFTSGCGICGSMEPVLGTVARVAPGAVAMANAGLLPDLAAEFTVRRVPTLLVLRRGEEVARIDDGFTPAETLVDLLEQHAA